MCLFQISSQIVLLKTFHPIRTGGEGVFHPKFCFLPVTFLFIGLKIKIFEICSQGYVT